MSKGSQQLERFIFWSRWLQAPLYLGLIVAQGIYVWLFMAELGHLLTSVFESGGHISETETMLVVLGLIDVVMIANLLIMVIIGGYETFVSRLDLEDHPDQPEWLSHVNAGVLKIKLSTAIIGISSIHLLKTFINASNLAEHTIKWQVIIHLVFLLSAMAMAYVDKMMNQ
ncbi:MAG TPA: TIGR00645 family protein, partial [Zoogloea sp.]|nr:TIGR00645 family protein [Zoogloea sp.]